MDRALAVMLSDVKHEEVDADNREDTSHKSTVGPQVDAVSSVVVRCGVSESVNFDGEWKPLITDVRSLNVKRSKSDPDFCDKMEQPFGIVYSEGDEFSRSFDAFPEDQRNLESYVTWKETAAESLYRDAERSNLFQAPDRRSGSNHHTGWNGKNGNKSDRAHSKWSYDGTTAAAYSCRYCEKRFSYASKMKRHEMMHTGEKPYSCANCEKRFTQKCDVIRHVQRHHTSEKVFACIQCYKRFATKQDLAEHTVVHSGIKRYVCSHCDKRFLRKQTLVEHVKRYSGEKPYSCIRCSRQFATRHDLARHEIVHSGEKPHGCQYCHKRFFTLGRLKRHSRRHLVEKPSTCSSCGKQVGLESELMAHSGDILDECQCCDEVSETPSQLEDRLQTATNETPPPIPANDGYPAHLRPYYRNELSKLKSSKRSAFPDGNIQHDYSCSAVRSETPQQIGDDTLTDTALILATDDKQFVDCCHPFAGKLLLCSDADDVSCDDDDNGCDPSTTRTDSPSSFGARFPAGAAKSYYVCENCPSRFSEAGQLLQHSLTHDVKTSYECEECRTRFADYGRLLWHMFVHARENRGWPSICSCCSTG